MISLAILTLSQPQAAEFSALVIDVIDGDSVRLQTQGGNRRKAQLNGLVAPPRKEAILALRALTAGHQVEVYWERRDKWRRLVATLTRDGLDVNREMIRLGHAWFYRPGSYPDAIRQSYAQAEDEARAAGRGLWGEDHEPPPWLSSP